MFFKKKKQAPEPKLILGMIMLRDENSFVPEELVKDLTANYTDLISEPTGDNVSLIFEVAGETIAIAHVTAPIPSGDIERTADYAYNWPEAIADTKEHKSHLIVSALKGGDDVITRFGVFTWVICSLLRTTNAIGVYMGKQALLIPAENYLEEAANMGDDYLPLNLWIYFGFRISDKGNSGYTFGLTEFSKSEIEIVNSSRNLEKVMGFLFDMTHYVIEYDVTFRDKQTCGSSEEERFAISYSKGVFTDGKTFKIAY